MEQEDAAKDDPPKKAESGGAIPKSGARSKTGGVRLGSFRLGGKKKPVSADKEPSRKAKKGKSESGDECRHTKRKLSTGGKRNSSTMEDDRYSTASSSTSVATGGRPSLEGEEAATANVADQSTTERELWLDLEEHQQQTSTKDQLLQITTTPSSMGDDAAAMMPEPPQQSNANGDGSSSAQQVGEKREHLYKILVIGELGTGKTSIIKRYVHQFFSQHYRATIGVDFALKVLNWDANTIIRLQLWDIAGQERFGNMTRVYYKEAVGAFIVFDVTRTATFEAVVKWKQDLDTKVQLPDGTPIPCVLLANKCDQQKEGLVNNSNKMDEYCRERGFTSWFETSAKENINIEEAAKCLVAKILQNDKLINHSDSARDLEKFALDGKNQRNQKNGKTCSC